MTSVLVIPCELSSTSFTLLLFIVSKKLGQPEPESNFASLENK